MDIIYKALRDTDIGRHVNGLCKHPSGEVRQLVKLLVRYDLLCLEGLARSLRVFIGTEASPVFKVSSIPRALERLWVDKELWLEQQREMCGRVKSFHIRATNDCSGRS
ncbi:uncharacterized protein LOC133909157 isoform X2 [Phragmites australis]|uniref:uncharacterized protein LOC133909157 isoform X2 n=1 Tax=Phragmites australis TaxID=29695 RepID=UPI002D7864BC|nr:uncharacterized protein LOC133909157 isoform X2 [Phragmites australis]XP_062207473.1 uncharacterized protein LOC133909157 isoform X2 [Phragmites australis]